MVTPPELPKAAHASAANPGAAGAARAMRGPVARLFREGFSTFLRRRRALRHFDREPLLGSLAAGHAPAAPEHLAADLLRAAAETPAESMTRLGSREQGLTATEAAQRLARDGPNEVAHEKPLPGWLRLWHCYVNPFNLLLTVLAALSWLSEDAKATLVVSLMVSLSTLMRFVQEGRSHKAAEGLRSLVGNTATVIRHESGDKGGAPDAPARREVPVRELVAGD